MKKLIGLFLVGTMLIGLSVSAFAWIRPNEKAEHPTRGILKVRYVEPAEQQEPEPVKSIIERKFG